MSDFKSGFVSILGKPNVGKSTLLNAILDQKLSIVSAKPQTTRRKITGIFNDKESQIVFIDTPGIIDPSYLLQKKMLEYVISAIQDSDILLLVVDGSKFDLSILQFKEEILNSIKNSISFLAINKVDLIENKNEILRLIDEANKLNLFKEIIPLSALDKDNVYEVVKTIKKYLPVHPAFFDEESISDAPTKFFITEIVREKIFENYHEEIPYSTEVLLDEYKERENSKDYISVSIVVERDSQKGIIIGKKGESLKRVGEMARHDIEKFIGKGVYLKIFVKVRENWRKDESKLKSFGY